MIETISMCVLISSPAWLFGLLVFALWSLRRPADEYRMVVAERQGEVFSFTPPPGGGWVLHSTSVKWNSLDLWVLWVRKGSSRS